MTPHTHAQSSCYAGFLSLPLSLAQSHAPPQPHYHHQHFIAQTGRSTISSLSHCPFFWLLKARSSRWRQEMRIVHREMFCWRWGYALVFCADERQKEGLELWEGTVPLPPKSHSAPPLLTPMPPWGKRRRGAGVAGPEGAPSLQDRKVQEAGGSRVEPLPWKSGIPRPRMFLGSSLDWPLALSASSQEVLFCLLSEPLVLNFALHLLP